jgi:hypothetical protein
VVSLAGGEAELKFPIANEAHASGQRSKTDVTPCRDAILATCDKDISVLQGFYSKPI